MTTKPFWCFGNFEVIGYDLIYRALRTFLGDVFLGFDLYLVLLFHVLCFVFLYGVCLSGFCFGFFAYLLLMFGHFGYSSPLRDV